MENFRKSRYGIDFGRFDQPYLSDEERGVKDDDFEPTRLSVSSQFQEPNNEKRWRLSHIKAQFESLELHQLFARYSQRISHGYFSQFLTLQIVLVTTHFITLAAASVPKDVIPDLILYGLISFLSIIVLVITDKFVKKHPKLLKFLAGAAFATVFFMNTFIPYYYRNEEKFGNLRPAYTAYLIISNYIFLNVHNDLVALVLGLFVSVFHIVTLVLVTYVNSNLLYERLGSDIIYLLCINGLGVHFRYMNEIVIRRSFLDRRSCVESTHQLKFEEDQANNLMASIIPQHVIDEVKKDIIKYYLENKPSTLYKNPFELPYVEYHPDVSILFADIVNYTAMTTKLSITELLDILNELFGRFDDASGELKVLRIKFLGDCYYCVAGLNPNPAPNHAEACVDLGLQMISIINDIRQRHKLDINMRIGIHTGDINSGIIGVHKWQYDIWSADVDIANKMETEGKEGKVHITEQTNRRLRKNYNKEKTNKVINGAPTFLISPSIDEEEKASQIGGEKTKTTEESTGTSNQRRPTIFVKRTSALNKDLLNGTFINAQNSQRSFSLNTNRATNGNSESSVDPKRHTFPHSNERRVSGTPGLSYYNRRLSTTTERRLTASDRKRRTAFMNNNIKRYKERLEQTNKELEETIEKMRLSKYEQWFKKSEMFKFWIVFKDWKNETEFVKIPDPLFKYYLLSEIVLVILVYILQNLSKTTWNPPDWPFYVTIGIIVVFCLPLSWTHYIYSKFIAKSDTPPGNTFIRFLYNSSKFITNNVAIRVAIYTGVYLLFCLCVLTEWINCSLIEESNSTTTTKQLNFFAIVFNSTETKILGNVKTLCIIPWHMTETCALAIMMSFLFLRMYMWLKTLYAFSFSMVYSFYIFQYGGAFWGESQSFNYLLDSRIAHRISVIFLTLVLHMVDRQTEYMNRLDHLWYKSLSEKEVEAAKIQTVNRGLLENILPIHVAEHYLNLNRNSSEEVFHEKYEDAAVMFASITNFKVEDLGPLFSKVMNTIISEFDMLLAENTFGRRIEKIKLAKWTYMAACGIAPGLGDTENKRKDQGIHVVISVLKFAASIMKALNNLSGGLQQEMKLRIGISHGSIAGGVVGSKKPLYDIWGDPVNMASRMDTTAEAGYIQVLKPTAEIIRSFGYHCHYRGKIKVKGHDPPYVSTYYVALDENFDLITHNTGD